jgi:hypothetical protein
LGHRVASRWVVPGSRLLPHVSAGHVMERIREGDVTRAKAAPLQALGTNMPRQRANPFEDDDEDEYDLDRLNHPFVASVDRDLGAGGGGEGGATQFCDDAGYGLAGDFGVENVAPFVIVNG